MPRATPLFRLFVCSTFEDLTDERNSLETSVFPILRDLCAAHGARFQPIDLRWGIADENAREHLTMEICIREIGRCQKTGTKPNFIILLGDRYGWKPLPSNIEASEFELLLSQVDVLGKTLLVWQDEQPEDAKGWYRKDENHVPSAYTLRPKESTLVDWEGTEARIREVLCSAVERLGWAADDHRWIKYRASAVHQEILCGLTESPIENRHCYAFFRQGDGDTREAAAEHLKDLVRSRLKQENIYYFQAGDLETFCDRAKEVLLNSIQEGLTSIESKAPFQLERENSSSFSGNHDRFVGRAVYLRRIAEYIVGEDEHPLILYGQSGSGKTSLMAEASRMACEWLPNAVVIRRFIGISAASSDGISLLRGISAEIEDRYNATPQPSSDSHSVVRTFHESLKIPMGTIRPHSTDDRPLLIFIDALDQLQKDDPIHSLSWLPEKLPAFCAVVLSTTELVPETQSPVVNIGPWSMDEANTALQFWLNGANRRLTPEQYDAVLTAFSRCPWPLYMKLAFEESRLWPSFHPLSSCILSDGIDGLVEQFLIRLSSKSSHGTALVSCTLGSLQASRCGLTETELLQLLSADSEVWQELLERAHHPPPIRSIPAAVWAKLFSDIEPVLGEHSAHGTPTIAFYHRHLADAVSKKYLKGEMARTRHERLADYFASQPDWLDAAKEHEPNLRKLIELPHQLLGANQLDVAISTLTSLSFVGAACAAELVFDLEDTYDHLIQVLPEGKELRDREFHFSERVHRWSTEIIRYAQQCNDQRRGLRNDTTPRLPEIPIIGNPHTSSERQPDQLVGRFNRLERLMAFAEFVRHQAYAVLEFGKRRGFLLQQALAYLPEGPVALSASAALEVFNAPLLVRRWPTDAKAAAESLLESGLEGHRDRVHSVSVSADGRRAISASADGTVRFWDLDSGRCLWTVEDRAEIVILTPDARLAVLGSGKYGHAEIQTFDLLERRCLRSVIDRQKSISSLSITPDARLALSGSEKGDLHLWDLVLGSCIGILPGHKEEVGAVKMTPDGRWAVSGSGDSLAETGELRLWDLDEAVCVKLLGRFSAAVTSVDITPDARRVVSGGRDNKLRIWDVSNGACVGVLESMNCLRCAMTPDGSRAIAADSRMELWDLTKNVKQGEWASDVLVTLSLAITADGRRVVCGGWDKVLHVWNIKADAAWRTAPSSAASQVPIGPLGTRPVLRAHRGGMIEILDAMSGSLLGVLGSHDGATDAAMLADRRLAVSWSATLVRLWDIERRTVLRTLAAESSSIESVAVTPDGGLVVAFFAGLVKVWNSNTGALLCTFATGFHGFGPGTALLPYAQQAVSVLDQNRLQLWNLLDGSGIRTLKGSANRVTGLDVTPDGRRVLSESDDQKLSMWDLLTGDCLGVWDNPKGIGFSVQVSADGCRALSVGENNALVVWDIANGKRIHVLEGHTWWIVAALQIPGGRVAVTSSADRTVRVWDLQAGACITVLKTPEAWIKITFDGVANRIIGKCTSGDLTFYELRGMRRFPAACTAEFARDTLTATVVCPWCQDRSPLPSDLTVTLLTNGTTPLQSGGFDLPNAALQESNLQTSCRNCRGPLRLNPFGFASRGPI